MSNDHKALFFLTSVAVLGASVRLVRAAGNDRPAAVAQPALDLQIQASDSARSAKKAHSGKRGSRRPTRQASDTIRTRTAFPSVSRSNPLDIDTATAAQLDLLPGVGPSLARRIVADRKERGPFLNRGDLRRVRGVGPGILARLDTLITFSGTIRPVSGSDESTFVGKPRGRPRPRARP